MARSSSSIPLVLPSLLVALLAGCDLPGEPGGYRGEFGGMAYFDDGGCRLDVEFDDPRLPNATNVTCETATSRCECSGEDGIVGGFEFQPGWCERVGQEVIPRGSNREQNDLLDQIVRDCDLTEAKAGDA